MGALYSLPNPLRSEQSRNEQERIFLAQEMGLKGRRGDAVIHNEAIKHVQASSIQLFPLVKQSEVFSRSRILQ